MKAIRKVLFRPVVRRLAACKRLRAIRDAIVQERLALATGEDFLAPTVNQIWSGAIDLSVAPKIAIFAHFDAEGSVSLPAQLYVKEIRSAGFAVVFVTSSPSCRDNDLREILPHVARVVWRKNVGHDFGAWRDGLALLGDVSRLNGLLLTNDSIYGPFDALHKTLERFDLRGDVWALTESREIARHLQSYFLYFGNRALRSKAFGEFWKNFRVVPGRAWAIYSGEIALSFRLRKAGLRLRAIADYKSVERSFRRRNRAQRIRETPPSSTQPRGRSETAFLLNDGHALNPTHFFWRELVEDLGVPFIKRDLVDRNPECIADVDEARIRVKTWLAVMSVVAGRSEPAGAEPNAQDEER